MGAIVGVLINCEPKHQIGPIGHDLLAMDLPSGTCQEKQLAGGNLTSSALQGRAKYSSVDLKDVTGKGTVRY